MVETRYDGHEPTNVSRRTEANETVWLGSLYELMRVAMSIKVRQRIQNGV